jgi:hypothetical protein
MGPSREVLCWFAPIRRAARVLGDSLGELRSVPDSYTLGRHFVAFDGGREKMLWKGARSPMRSLSANPYATLWPDAAGVVSWVHFGDLYMTTRDANYDDLTAKLC